VKNACRVSILGVQNAATQHLCRIFRTGNPGVILRLFDGKGQYYSSLTVRVSTIAV